MTEAKKSDKPLTPATAWQPFTPRGVAAFSSASFGRLLVVQITLGLCLAATVVWFLTAQWFPVIEEAIRELPDQGLIRRGTLNMSLTNATRLAGNRHLAIVLSSPGEERFGPMSDLELRFGQRQVETCSLLGCAATEYPSNYVIAMNREELEPWWGAWRSPLAAGIGVGIVVTAVVLWWVLGIPAAALILIFCYFSDRNVAVGGSWRVAMAAQLAGTPILMLLVSLYGYGVLDMLRLMLGSALYVICSLLFMVLSPVFLSKSTRAGANPFSPANDAGAPSKSDRARDDNPFSSPPPS